jgi:uncharacterized protein (DUF1810 family)
MEPIAHFVAAQDPLYDQVIRELKAGRKQTHWMWFIFPQLAGLGSSAMAQKYALHSLAEAREYLKHPTLGARLRECTQLLVEGPSNNIQRILGYPDHLKFRSSMTLFALAAPEESMFQQALDKFYGGEADSATVETLAEPSHSEAIRNGRARLPRSHE